MRVLWLLCSLVLLVLLTASDADATEASIATPTRLHVTRTTNLFHPAPLDVTVQNQAAVQRLYQAAFQLEPVSPVPVVRECGPGRSGRFYTLDFFQGEVKVQQMHLNLSGCGGFLIGSRGADVRHATSDFLALLARTIGIPSLLPD